ncbi:MAG: DUF4345 domain-containing protein [Bacteroidota bacterium]
MNQLPKNTHLVLSAAIVFLAALIYGADPTQILPFIFDFEVQSLELKNIFRAIMGLYIAFALYWIVGIRYPERWKGATISNVVFMGGLASGRLISLLLDGISTQYSIGMLLEFGMLFWGMYNLKKFPQ